MYKKFIILFLIFIEFMLHIYNMHCVSHKLSYTCIKHLNINHIYNLIWWKKIYTVMKNICCLGSPIEICIFYEDEEEAKIKIKGIGGEGEREGR